MEKLNERTFKKNWDAEAIFNLYKKLLFYDLLVIAIFFWEVYSNWLLIELIHVNVVFLWPFK